LSRLKKRRRREKEEEESASLKELWEKVDENTVD
jgi:hypothetical protein